MLTNVLRTLIKNPIKESFYGKREKIINILTVFFFISHKSDVKTFLKWIFNECSQGTRQHDPITNQQVMSRCLTDSYSIHVDATYSFNKSVMFVFNSQNYLTRLLNIILLIYLLKFQVFKLTSYCSICFLTFCNLLIVILGYTFVLNNYL